MINNGYSIRNLLYVFLFIYTQVSFSQKKYTQQDVNSLSLVPYLDESFKKFKAMLESDSTLIGWSYYYRSKAYYHLINKRNDSALFYASKGTNFFKLNPDHEVTSGMVCNYIEGDMLMRKKAYRESTESLLNALRILKTRLPENHQDRRNYRGFIYSRLQKNFILLGDHRRSIKYGKEAIIDSTYAASSGLGVSYMDLGLSMSYLKKNDSALYYQYKALQALEKKGIIRNIIACYNNIGMEYKELGVQDSMRYYFNIANKTLRDEKLDEIKDGINTQPQFVAANMAYLNILDGSYQKAEDSLYSVLNKVKNRKLDRSIKDLRNQCYDYLIECYYKSEQYDKIIPISNKKNELLVNFERQFLDENLQTLETKYEVKEKNEKIVGLTEENKEQATILKQQQIILIGFVLFMGVLILSGYLIYRQRRLKNDFEKVVLEQKLLRSQMNPHFLFNALNTVCAMVSNKSNSTLTFIGELSGLLRLILKNSRQNFISLSEEKEVLTSYLDLESRFGEQFDFDLQIGEGLDEICVPPMLIQPFVENSIQHGFHDKPKRSKIKINFQKDKSKKMVVCSIEDNGKGYSDTKSNLDHDSYSGTIVQERLQIFKKEFKVNCRLNIFSEEDKGTQVVIYMPFVLNE